MANRKYTQLFELMDALHDHKENIDYYAIQRTESGNRLPNRLSEIEKSAAEIEEIAKKIQLLVKSMRRKQGANHEGGIINES
ncbi:hypothetical protein [Paenibacillus donghaensis]|uniref:Uncharacterized protein n=1 Tax=Paenibacillus donghaensis TaxID=414771 RepID=A0A2Z2KD56_9BACL|nr:hypothetical protein [Paenibacillus donghaensis]ASA20923.1 hypothetical protein B9T62_09080 [Paenibacillus donghaensis]